MPTLQSSINAGIVVELVRRISVHDLSEDVSQQLENVIGTEGNEPLELQFNADKEDGALGQLDANHSSTRRARSLTEKGRLTKYWD